MNEMKFNFLPQKNRVVKFQGTKIEVRPYLTLREKSLINQICFNKFKGDENSENNIHLIRDVFNLCVLALTTNIQVPGITFSQDGDNLSLDIDVKEEIITDVEASGIFDVIIANVPEYERVWADILTGVENANSFVSFASMLPNAETQKKDIEELKTLVADFNEKHPKEAADVAMKKVIAAVKTEKKETKAKNKKK